MQYSIKNLVIESGHPATKPSQPLLKWIKSQDQVDHALDYGCGKLRYSTALAEKCNTLTLVDCDTELNKTQTIYGQKTTIRSYVVSEWPSACILTIKEFETDPQLYNLVLCANVLPIIPTKEARKHVLRTLRNSLAPDGICLFVTQHRNSRFKRIAALPNAIPHLDGWLWKDSKGYGRYYGLLPKTKLESLIQSHKFAIIRSWIEGQSTYVLARNTQNDNIANQNR